MTGLTLVPTGYRYPFKSDMSPEMAVAVNTRFLCHPQPGFRPPFIEGHTNLIGAVTVKVGERELHPEFEVTVFEATSLAMVRGIALSLNRNGRCLVSLNALFTPISMEGAIQWTEGQFMTDWEEYAWSGGRRYTPALTLVPNT